jgi:CheY-like chemotaxis protein
MTVCIEEDEIVTTEMIPVLWMDNEPKNVAIIKKFIEEEKKVFQIQVDIVQTIEDARKMLASGRYAAIVVDCKMDDFDVSVNGAEFLREIAAENPALPRFVYSAYLEDPRYEHLIDQSAVIARASKVDDRFVPPLANHEFFRKLNYAASQFFRVRDKFPEQIEFGSYRLDPERYANEVAAHWQKHGSWITADMAQRNWVWCVAIGIALVAGSSDLADFPNERDLLELGEKYNLIPFAYGGMSSPEEMPGPGPTSRASWSKTSYSNDWYPTFHARVNGNDVEADFDTGAYCTYVPDDLVRKGLWNFSRDGTHLGKPYKYFTKTVPFEVIDQAGVSSVREVAVAVVESWQETGFIDANPNRRCLVGRDLLRNFPVVIVLDSGLRTTIVRHIGMDRRSCPFTKTSSGKMICTIVP